MGMSNSDIKSMEFKFLSKPTLEFSNGNPKPALEDHHGDDRVIIPALSIGEFINEDEEEDGFRTPTAIDKRIPLIPPFPPTPMKSKSRSSTTKRKSSNYQFLDVWEEIDSLFPPELLADFGRKIKKARGFVNSL